MTWAGLVTKNLLRRKARTALTVAGVAIGVGLIVALLSITTGVKRTAAELIHVGRSDFGLFQSGAADLTRSLLPEELAGNVRRSEGVSQVARVFLLVGAVEQSDSSLLFGYVPGEFPERRLVVVSGRRPTGNEALVGDGAARIYRPTRGRAGASREAQLQGGRDLPQRERVRRPRRRPAAAGRPVDRPAAARGDDARGDASRSARRRRRSRSGWSRTSPGSPPSSSPARR